MKILTITSIAFLSQLRTLVNAAPPLALPSPNTPPTTSLFLTAPDSSNLTAVPALGSNPPPTPFYWSSPGNSHIVVKFTHTSSTTYRHPEYVAKALEDSYFETLYHLGPQGGGAATRLGRPLNWAGAPAQAADGTDLKVTPGPALTWSFWSHVLAGMWNFSLRYQGFDVIAEIETKDAPGVNLGTVSFLSRTSR